MSRGAAAVLLAALFLSLRLVLLFARDPFFDEMFTVWMAHQPFGAIVEHLRHDSGPPLYYFLARIANVTALRVLSLLFACVPFALLLWRRNYIAAALLAVFPPAVLFAVDARAYALCGAMIAIAIVLLDDDRPYAAAIALVLAAYSHYYGVLFFPALLVGAAGALARRSSSSFRRARRPPLQRFGAFALAAILYIPGFCLAAQQPKEATAWLGSFFPLAPLTSLSFAGDYPAALFAPPPRALIVIALIVALLALARSWRYAHYVLVPLVLAVAFAFLGRRVWFPMRFDSVIAFPLVLWLAASLERWKRKHALVAALLGIALFVDITGIADHLQRPPDAYRQAARFAASRNLPIVASGYCYLETAVLAPNVIAFPREQAVHPGWRATLPSARLHEESGSALPQSAFVWVGERSAPELAVLQSTRRIEPVIIDRRAVVARVLPAAVH
ncbi:MAG TPA: hypothetical protein VFN10_13705 [Thermoanaerobaculia bacterium]|nr:hypothetical protein [Thermoanaerobaculia bacterium]